MLDTETIPFGRRCGTGALILIVGSGFCLFASFAEGAPSFSSGCFSTLIVLAPLLVERLDLEDRFPTALTAVSLSFDLRLIDMFAFQVRKPKQLK